ncbi:major facilitator superfamily domain-containing protein [Podospora didyma]|uniref:Major facilitator superfamily domain-containing protein n=1 Tax=Podospora didyma TaxID=330526 RepID=A0AAE0NQS1_9PEZI|nr:major facilitator superfamily domain-containing protein [Podospora didyma]
MSAYVLALFGSNFIAPIVGGWFANQWGWKWMMHFGAMFAAACFVILYFFMEETMYFRDTLEGLEDNEPIGGLVATDNPVSAPAVGGIREKESRESSSNASQTSGVVFAGKKTFVQKLKPFICMPGRPTNAQMFKAMLLPLAIIFQFPNVAWAGFIYGINLSWYNVLNATASPVLSAAPYNWGTGLVGSIYTGPVIGAIFGCLWSGLVADRFTLYLARRNNGIREPEQRLWPLAFSALMSCVGLIVWGVGASLEMHWAGLAVGLGILAFSCVTGGSIALSYNIDCFKDISGDSTTAIIVIRNTLGFAMSYGITPWYTNIGLQNCFIMAGFLSLACTLTFLLMVWKGKALRKWSAARYWKYAAKTIVSH